MNTKNDLIAGLQNALRLMNNMVVLENKRKNTQLQYARPLPLKPKLSGGKLIIRFLLISIVITMIVSTIIDPFLGRIYWFLFGYNVEIAKTLLLFTDIVIGIAGALFTIKIMNNSIVNKNNEIIEQNKKMEERNQSIYKAETEIIQQMKVVQQQYANEILPWYPNDYCYIAAAEFFLNSIQNFRADNLKEAVNLYEDALHKGRLEQAQQQMVENQDAMVRQQRLGNILAMGNIAMQAGIQNSINTAANTQSANMQYHTRAVNDLKDTIKQRFR